MAGSLTDIIFTLINLLLLVVPVLVAFTLLVFLWGLAQSIFAFGGNEDAVKKGRDRMVWGLIALFVILSLGGLIAILQTTFFGERLGSGGGSNSSSLNRTTSSNQNQQIVIEEQSGPFRFGVDRFCIFGRGVNCTNQ